ncbi:hypothetical protein CDEST_14469 [Colletotrichum destructivum]|uniref:Uncharacterized protein n=1 Tax=Colletotrichum destructivum TaxID=34406 RepID=A0AAX4J206_9PEZI|nr:hypothetical protein CDEST_14469 [Colletotrichum destructivum]
MNNAPTQLSHVARAQTRPSLSSADQYGRLPKAQDECVTYAGRREARVPELVKGEGTDGFVQLMSEEGGMETLGYLKHIGFPS